MKEIPILFSTEMVKAILDGRKVQTRRVMKFQQSCVHSDYAEAKWKKATTHWVETDGEWHCKFCGNGNEFTGRRNNEMKGQVSPYGKVGDILWVRETWQRDDTRKCFYFKADGTEKFDSGEVVKEFINVDSVEKWKPSIFMPKTACRLKLKITDVRVERLQDITFEDVLAEGIPEQTCPHGNEFYREETLHYFSTLWDSLNKKRDFGWSKNPFVWVIEFEKII